MCLFVNRNCDKCAFFWNEDSECKDEIIIWRGKCKRYPPTYSSRHISGYSHPLVQSGDWCYEFADKIQMNKALKGIKNNIARRKV